MKVLFDHQAFTMQRFGGISKYHVALQKELLSLGVSSEIFAPFSDNYYLSEAFSNTNTIRLPLKKHFLNRAIFHLNNQITKSKIRNINDCIFQPTFYDPYFRNCKMPVVLTVHDLTHELYFEKSPVVESFLKKKKEAILRADQIIAISNNTKHDLIHHYDIDPNKVSVIYHGVYQAYIQKNESDRKAPYLLYVGERQGYKNFCFMLESISPILKEFTLNLVCCGKPFSDKELELIKKLDLSDLISVKQPNDQELNILYNNATLFIYPSLYEGFGMPILEAFSNKCPICISNSSSFPEIARNGALYFDPKDKDSIYSTIRKAVLSEDLRLELVEKGGEIVKDYTWQNTAKCTIEVYKNLIL
ncbi:MAG: glycosyltransferase family 4 protein [Turicibacter sp.]